MVRNRNKFAVCVRCEGQHVDPSVILMEARVAELNCQVLAKLLSERCRARHGMAALASCDVVAEDIVLNVAGTDRTAESLRDLLRHRGASAIHFHSSDQTSTAGNHMGITHRETGQPLLPVQARSSSWCPRARRNRRT